MIPSVLHASALLTESCVAGLWEGLLIATMATALCVLMRRASAATRHSVLIASFASALVMPWIGGHGLRAASSGQGFRLAPAVGATIAVLWLVAAAVRGAQLVQAWRHLCRVRRRAVPVTIQGREVFAAGKRRAVLCSSPDVDAPTILGLWSPRLLLPEWMVPGLSEGELQQIALHECEHLRRGDDWTNLLLQVAVVLSPLNPALPWLNRTIRLQRELAVDAAVVAHTAEPLAYATCLTRLAEQRKQRGALRLAVSAWGRKAELVQRVHALLERSCGWNRMQSAAACGAAMAVLLTTVGLMSRVPELVQVGDAPATMLSRVGDAVIRPAADAMAVPMVQTVAERDGRSAGGFAAARAVETSFEVAPRRQHVTPVRRKLASRARAALLRAEYVQDWESRSAVRAARASNAGWRVIPASYAVSRSQGDDVYRAVPTVFYTPYAAVPVANGWLLIEL